MGEIHKYILTTPNTYLSKYTIFTEIMAPRMEVASTRPPIKKYCQYNFCGGEHSCIVQKRKNIPKPNEYILLALANTTQIRMKEEKMKNYHEKENKIVKYNAKMNEKSVTQLKKRALKLTDEKFGAR